MAFVERGGTRPTIDLRGPEGNSFVLLGKAGELAKQLGLDDKTIKAEMMSGDYDNLIRVFDKYFGQHVDLVGFSDPDDDDMEEEDEDYDDDEDDCDEE